MSQQDNTWSFRGTGDLATQRKRYQRRIRVASAEMEDKRRELEGALACAFHEAYFDPSQIFTSKPADKVLLVQVEDDRYTGLAKYCYFAFNGLCEPRVRVILPTGESKHYAATSVFPAPADTPVPEWALTPLNISDSLFPNCRHQNQRNHMPINIEVVADIGQEVWFIHPLTRKAAYGVVRSIEVQRRPANPGSQAPIYTSIELHVLHKFPGGSDGSVHVIDGSAAFATKADLLASL